MEVEGVNGSGRVNESGKGSWKWKELMEVERVNGSGKS